MSGEQGLVLCDTHEQVTNFNRARNAEGNPKHLPQVYFGLWHFVRQLCLSFTFIGFRRLSIPLGFESCLSMA